jgi:signal transduction histidine kinase
LVYGKRATPYEVLSEFSARMGSTQASEDLLPRMARILAEGTGAAEALVWLKVGDELRPEARWPDGTLPVSLQMHNGELPAQPEATLALPVTHRDELLGALTLTKPPGERLTPAEDKLASDLASQAGLVLRNVRLTEQLLARLEELRASRQRIVSAQDHERRRLERNIHDGAQQQLVALAVRIRLARSLAEQDPERAEAMMEQIGEELGQALDDLRDLARGIYPPLLADQGLVAALQAQARRALVPVHVEAQGVGRYPQEAEGAVYFCVLEALQNIAKYAQASRVIVRLRDEEGGLGFEVRDDGAGFDPKARGYGTGLQGMADRLAALGGGFEVRSSPGEGTTVIGRVPIGALESVG